MKVHLDLPYPVHRELKIRAAREGTTMRQLILRGLEINLARKENAESEESVIAKDEVPPAATNPVEP